MNVLHQTVGPLHVENLYPCRIEDRSRQRAESTINLAPLQFMILHVVASS